MKFTKLVRQTPAVRPICAILVWLCLASSLHALDLYKCTQEISCYDPKAPTRLLYIFKVGSKLKASSSKAKAGYVMVWYMDERGNVIISGFCKANDLVSGAEKLASTNEPEPEMPAANEPPPAATATGSKSHKGTTASDTPAKNQLQSDAYIVKNGMGQRIFYFQTALVTETNGLVKVGYEIPVDKDGLPTPMANNLVFYATAVNGKVSLGRELPAYLTKQLGCSVFTIYAHSDLDDLSDSKKFYYYPESGWHDVVFAVQDQIVKERSLQKRKLILVGLSGGGSMVQQMGIYAPNKVDAIAAIAAGYLAMPTNRTDVASCMVYARTDPRSVANREFADKTRSFGANIISVATAPKFETKYAKGFDHGTTQDGRIIVQEFLEAITKNRDLDGKLLDYHKWPFVGSWKNSGSFSTNSPSFSKEIPESERVYYPSQKVAELASSQFQVTEPIIAKCDTGKLWGYISRPSAASKGVIILSQDWDSDPEIETVENLNYFAKYGFTTISVDFRAPNFRASEKEDLENLNALIKWSSQQEEFNNKDFFLVGAHFFGKANFLAASQAGANQRIKLRAVASIGAELDTTPEFLLSIKKLKVPGMIVIGENILTETNAQAAMPKIESFATKEKILLTSVVIKGAPFNLKDPKWFDGMSNIVLFLEQHSNSP